MKVINLLVQMTLFVCLTAEQSLAQTDYFDARRDTIQTLDSVKLAWSILGADSVLITGIGRVPKRGDTSLRLLHSKQFILLYTADSLIISKTLTIAVNGVKGPEDFVENYLFVYQSPLRLPTGKLSIDHFFEKILDFLKNSGFVAELDNHLNEGFFTIRTKLASDEFLLPSPANLTYWLAYKVDFKTFDITGSIDKGLFKIKKPAVLECVISPFIEYNRVNEPAKIQPLPLMENGAIYIKAANNLKRQLNTLLNQ